MSYQFKKFPIDILLFILWGILILPVTLLNIDDMFRIIIGLPFLLFIPGYMLIFILFPIKTDCNGINTLERIGLSFGFSIALVSLLGLLLNFTPWGIQLISVLFSTFFIIESLGVIALFRWITTSPEKRFTISIDISQFKSSSIIEKILSIFILLTMILALSSIVYITLQPKIGETFTDFYLLTSNGNATNYPQDLAYKQNTSLKVGLINHEHKMMNYTIEVWLIDETVNFNETTHKNNTIYHHALFMDKIDVPLNHTDITNKKNQMQKWEYNYTFSINKIGHFKLAFLLFTTPSENFDPEQDYYNSIEQRILNAYRELHIWLYVG